MRNNERISEYQLYEKLYHTARWGRLRKRQLREHPLCIMCASEARVTAAKACDHVKPHKGDLSLFWNPNNLQSLCVSCHNRTKAQQERMGYSLDVGRDGSPRDFNHPFNR